MPYVSYIYIYCATIYFLAFLPFQRVFSPESFLSFFDPKKSKIPLSEHIRCVGIIALIAVRNVYFR